nr:hypothetical protein [Tanacetum cinerariifolium]
MQDDEAEPAKLKEASAARRRKGVVIRDPKETATPSVIVHSKPKSKDKRKGILVEERKPLKRQAQIEQDEAYARELEAEINTNINWNEVIEQNTNDVVHLQALIDRRKVIITEDTVKQALRLDDADSIDCLPNEEIFAQLARMGYEKPSTKLTFNKAFFSAQWKFLIHKILQCMSAKRTAWNEFSSFMASAVICLATVRKFNFSKYIFDSLIRNVDNPSKFYMYPRFLQLMIDAQVGDLSSHTTKYTSPTLIQKVFANMRRVGKGFSGVDTPLFDGMLVPQQVHDDVGDNIVDDVPDVFTDADVEPTPPSPTPATTPPHQLRTYPFIFTITAASTTIIAAPMPKASDTRRREGVVIRDPEEIATPSVIVNSEPKSKDKGKRILVEEPKPLKRQAQIEQDEAYTRELEAELNANINWNEVIEHVKRKENQDNTIMRYQALKRKPQTEAQGRKNMMVYLKNMAKYKMDFFKDMTYDKIRPIFEKQFNSIMAFLKKRERELEEEAIKQSKRKRKTSEEKAAKKHKLDKEVEDLKTHLQIVPNDEDDAYTEATPVVDYQV